MKSEGVIFLYDHFQPLNLLTVPLHDQFCFHAQSTCRVIRGQRVQGVLKNLRERSESIRKYRQMHSRTRAYVIFANQIEDLSHSVFFHYMELYESELYELGVDPCFVHILPEGYSVTCDDTSVVEHHQKVSMAFQQVANSYDTFNVYLTKNDLCGTSWQSEWKDRFVERLSKDLLEDYYSWRGDD